MNSDSQDIRWKQRFCNFSKAFKLLKQSLQISELSDVERAGLIQFFEMTFELSWKLLKDYLEAEGYKISSPRDSLKQAFQSGVIHDGHVWIEALDDRNLTVHTYDEATALEVECKIRNKYYPVIEKLYFFFNNKFSQ